MISIKSEKIIEWCGKYYLYMTGSSNLDYVVLAVVTLLVE